MSMTYLGTIYNSRNSIAFIDKSFLLKTSTLIYNSRNSIAFIDYNNALKDVNKSTIVEIRLPL